MDMLSNSVRELAPDVAASDDDIRRARAALDAAIAAESARGTVRRARSGSGRPSWLRLSPGVLAAATAVLVVAAIAAGALVTSQLLSRPAPHIAEDPDQLDLSRPLLDQLAPGESLRVGMEHEGAEQFTSDELTDPGDSYVVIRSTFAHYLSPLGDEANWVTVSEDEPSELIETSGVDGERMAAILTPGEQYVSDVAAPSPADFAAIGDDADSVLAAFADRALAEPPATPTERERTFWALAQGDPLWFILSAEQRAAVLTAIDDVGSTTVRSHDGVVEVALALPSMLGGQTMTLDEGSLLPISSTFGSASASGAALPDGSIRYSYTAVTDVPEQIVPAMDDSTSCNGVRFSDAYSYYDGLADSLTADGEAAVAGEDVPPLADDEWTAIAQSPDQVILWSWVLHGQQWSEGPVPSGMTLDDPAGTHELMTITRTDGVWRLSGWETCVLKQVVPGAEVPDIALDPAHPLDPASSEIHLLVGPPPCLGTTSADQLEVRDLAEFDDSPAVEVLVVYPTPTTEESCEGGDPVPFTVQLSRPLGDRFIRDLSYFEERRLN